MKINERCDVCNKPEFTCYKVHYDVSYMFKIVCDHCVEMHNIIIKKDK